MIRLYIIDDHFLILEGICHSFHLDSGGFKVVGGSLNIEDALQNIPSAEVDIIILDLFIPRTDPLKNLQCIQEAFPGIPVVILTQEDSLLWQTAMIRHGASAYICKTEKKAILIETLKLVAEGQVIMKKEVAESVIIRKKNIDSDQATQEFNDIMNRLVSGLNIKKIAEEIKQSESSVDKKLKYYRKLFNAKTNVELVSKYLFR